MIASTISEDTEGAAFALDDAATADASCFALDDAATADVSLPLDYPNPVAHPGAAGGRVQLDAESPLALA